MTTWVNILKENRNEWDIDRNPVFENIVLKYQQARDTLVNNVLDQLGYDLDEVFETQGACIQHDIRWEKENYSQKEYLAVEGVYVGEIALVSDVLSDRLEVKVYGK